MNFSLAPPPFDADNYGRVLASLSEPGLLTELKTNALAQNVERTRAAIAAGVFDARRFDGKVEHDGTDAENLATQWTARCNAIWRVAELATAHETTTDPLGRERLVEFPVSDAFKEVLVDFCHHVAAQGQAWKNMLDDSVLPLPSFTRAMHLACMVNAPAALESLAIAMPDAVLRSTPQVAMGDFTFNKHNDGSAVKTTPLFTALQFSSTACVEVLVAHGVGNDALFHRSGDSSFMDSLDDLLHCGNPETCLPLMVRLTELADTQAQLRQNIIDWVEFSSQSEGSRNFYLRTACLEAGWTRIDPEASLRSALQNDNADVIASIQDDIDWELIADGALSQTLSLPIKALDRGNALAVQAYLVAAQHRGEHGCQAALSSFMENKTSLTFNEAQTLLGKSGLEVLPQLLLMGLDPQTPLEGSPVTFEEFAKNEPGDGHGMLRSFSARRSAHALIAEIENPTPSKAQP